MSLIDCSLTETAALGLEAINSVIDTTDYLSFLSLIRHESRDRSGSI